MVLLIYFEYLSKNLNLVFLLHIHRLFELHQNIVIYVSFLIFHIAGEKHYLTINQF